MQRVLVAESARPALVQRAGATVSPLEPPDSLPRGRESNGVDTPSPTPCDPFSSDEPNPKRGHGRHWFPRFSATRSRFVGMLIPFEQTSGRRRVRDGRERGGALVVRIKDENQHARGPALKKQDALTTHVQFAKSLRSVMDSQAAFGRADASQPTTLVGGGRAVDGTSLTRRIGFAVTRGLRPIVRLFTLALVGDESLMSTHKSSEELVSANCLRASRSLRFVALLRSGEAGWPRRMTPMRATRNTAPSHSAGHPFPNGRPHARRFSLRCGTAEGLLASGREPTNKSPSVRSSETKSGSFASRAPFVGAHLCARATRVWSSAKRVTYGKLICTLVTYRRGRSS